MGKYKCEYFSNATNKKEVAIMSERDQILDIITQDNVDFNKGIKIYEKKSKWELVYHRVNDEILFKNFDNGSRKENVPSPEQPSDFLKPLTKAIFEACPSRLEKQGFMGVLFDSVFGNEDVSKPKIEVIKGK